MDTPDVFAVERDGDTLLVAPLRNVCSLTDIDYDAELQGLLGALKMPELKNLVIDLEKVSYFDSTMLDMMVVLAHHVRQAQGSMALCNVSGVGRDILHVVRFDTLWPIFPSRDDALRAVQAGAENQ